MVSKKIIVRPSGKKSPTPTAQIVAGKGNKGRLAVLLEISRNKQKNNTESGSLKLKYISDG